MSDIKLSPAMITALKGAEVVNGQVFVPTTTKMSTVKALYSRGLTLSAELGALNPEGVEAARQLGNDTTVWQSIPVQDEPLADWERELLGSEIVQEDRTSAMLTDTQQGALEDLAELLDTPVVVPNRADKRRAKFSLRGAVSRMNERKRARRAAKYGDTKFSQAA